MSIYKRIPYKQLKKIYENHHGKIPKDVDGRTYDIHHVDGNKSNNNPSNLIAVSIQEHYKIHHSQEDWGACYAISLRMRISIEERSELSKKVNRDKIKNGTHPFQKRSDGTSLATDRVKNGTHPMIGIGKKHHSYNPTIFEFRNDDGRVHICDCYDLRIMYPEICKKQLSAVIHGKKKSVKGWRIS